MTERTFGSLRNIGFNVVDDLSEIGIADEVSDEDVQRQRTGTHDAFDFFISPHLLFISISVHA